MSETHKWTRLDGTSTTPPNGGPNHGMAPHMGPTMSNSWLNSTRFLNSALSGHPSRQKPLLRLPRLAPKDTARRCSAEHRYTQRSSASHRSDFCRDGGAVPDRAGKARPSKTGPWREPNDFAFGHRIGRSHGARRCRQSSQLASVPTAVFPRPLIRPLRTGDTINTRSRSTIGSCPRLGSHPMSGLVV